MRTMVRIAGKCKGKSKGQASRPEASGKLLGLDSRVELIQASIPLGLEAANDLLQQEVTALVGERYSRHGDGGALSVGVARVVRCTWRTRRWR